MFIWASLVAYSRIYMGVHYPCDVIVGALIGALIGIAVKKLYDFYVRSLNIHRKS